MHVSIGVGCAALSEGDGEVTGFTKGPWKAVTGTSTGMAVIAPNEPKVRKNVCGVGGQNRIFNAHLISASPELYEALECILTLVTPEFEESPMVAFAYATLAKARGES